jgi:transposase, IS5 family
MRRKKEAVLSFQGNVDALPKTVLYYRAKYQAISQVLDRNPEILDLVHEDLRKISQGSRRGRKGDYTSENILRALLVQCIEGLSLRDAVVRIADSEFLQDFLRMRKRAVMDHSFLDKCFKAVRPETWKRVNELLGRAAVCDDLIEAETIRTDTTVVEANIHYPTDCWLLWDTWRVASRLLGQAREIFAKSVPHRFHDRKIKRLYLYITRYMASKSQARQRKVKKAFRTLLERVTWILEIAGEFCVAARRGGSIELSGVAAELEGFLPAMRVVLHNARRAQIDGEKVPASERVFSIFEPHVELIQRGKRQKPIEFGHKILLCQTREKFITDYETYELQQPDCTLAEPAILRHETLFGAPPEVLASDMGFCPAAEKLSELRDLVGTLAIPRRLRDFADKTLAKWQAFRAGIEGTISALKRAFRLYRCFFRGFKSFAAAVGLSVLCHNLIVLAGSS